jgi:protease PrsW
MPAETLLRVLIGVAPVICLLAALLYLDSYKLVRARAVIALILSGAAVAALCYALNGVVLAATGMELASFRRYVSPVIEELAKGVVVVALVRSHRIGFLVDAAIFGFAIGTGFAATENLYYLRVVGDADIATWIARGFGTAIMHGGATALFAVTSVAIAERAGRATVASFVPGFAVAAALHSAFNHLAHVPKIAIAAILVALPPLLYAVFRRSDIAVGDWLGRGFDADTEMLELINSGRLSDSPPGRYLHSLKRKFRGPVVADILCYLRLHTELALRAKGILLMRENGFDVPIDDETRAKFDEMRYLERSIGKTGLLAVHPMLHMSHKDLWQLYMLGK